MKLPPRKNWFEELNQLPCLKCGSRRPPLEVNEDYMGHVLMEYDTECFMCGAPRNHWAYGYFQYPETWTGHIKWHLSNLFGIKIPRMFISHWGFTERSDEFIYIRRYEEGELSPSFYRNRAKQDMFLYRYGGTPQFRACRPIDSLAELKGDKMN